MKPSLHFARYTVPTGQCAFMAEELDFILNYDIKYRLGRESEEEGE
jgi:hypothetical protein